MPSAPGPAAPPLRSLLFTPGDQEDKVAKVTRYEADAVVLDMEDAVAASRKDVARTTVCAALPRADGDRLVMVRVNGADTGMLEADVAAVASAGARCLVIPKVEDAELLREIDATLGEIERAAGGGDRPPTLLVASIETAVGLLASREIAAAVPDRTLTLLFGSADFRADLGLDAVEGEQEVLLARSTIVVAARAAGLCPPVDGPYLDLGDDEGLAESSRRARGLGFGGRVVLHPGQLAAVHAAFGTGGVESEEIARQIVAEFEQAERDGRAAIQVAGRFVDYPVYEQARRLLERLEVTPGPESTSRGPSGS